jgi:chemotaxis methyl-accepting protein methylase
MHKLMAGVTILEHELSELRLLVERQAGILLDCPNSALAAHVAEYLENHELDSPAALLASLRACDQDPSLLPQFLDGVLNVNTGFFRHPGAMTALARHVVPQLYSRKVDDGPCTLRIWSAGCATGEEAYSIAMALCDTLPGSMSAGPQGCGTNGNGGGNGYPGSSNGNGKESRDKEKDKEKNGANRNGGIDASSLAGAAPPKDWSVHIVGTDLLPSAIEVAERGLYPQSALMGLPPANIRACFSKIGNANTAQTAAQEASPNGGASDSAAPSSGAESNGRFLYESNGRSNGATNGGVSSRSNGTQTGASNGNGAHLLVKPRLRSLVTFNTMNLTKPVYIGRFDCIFCMDVLPHLSRVQRTALLERLHLYLEPGGYLFLSQTEKVSLQNLNFRQETFDGYTVHRKPLAASAAYGR